MKKMIIYATLAFGLLVSSTSAFASPIVKNSTGQSFTAAWELPASGTNWLMKYGFNTAWINEDYTHTTHSTLHHTATVSNGNGAFADSDSAGNWAGIEVTHSGTYVEYILTY